jgi:plastocyanin
MMPTRSVPRWSSIPLLVLTLFACEPRADEPPADPAAGVPAAVETRTINVTLDEWSVALDADTVDAGTVVFAIVNNGQYAHVLEVERGDDEWETDRLGPGESTTLEVTLEPGIYEVYCPIDDEHGSHAGIGMRTTLVVR